MEGFHRSWAQTWGASISCQAGRGCIFHHFPLVAFIILVALLWNAGLTKTALLYLFLRLNVRE